MKIPILLKNLWAIREGDVKFGVAGHSASPLTLPRPRIWQRGTSTKLSNHYNQPKQHFGYPRRLPLRVVDLAFGFLIKKSSSVSSGAPEITAGGGKKRRVALDVRSDDAVVSACSLLLLGWDSVLEDGTLALGLDCKSLL